MDSHGLRDAFRVDVDDNVTPYLWSDADIASYADDAQIMFCRLTNGIGDATSNLCTIDMDVGEAFASLDPRIMKIRRIQRDSDAKPLRIINVEDVDTEGIRLDDTTGTVDAVITGMEDNKLRWVRIPAVADTATMTIFRMPLRTITTTRAPLEIESQHHRHLLLWMEHLAYGKQDTDTYNAKKSADKEDAFRAYCAAVKKEQDKERHKTRVVRYGGY